MKVFKLLLTSVLVIGFIVPGCNPDLGCDCSAIPKYFDLQGANINFLEEAGTDASDAYQWADFRGQIIYDTEFYGNINVKRENSWNGFSLIPTASACSCAPEGWAGSEEGMDSLIITTVNDYNANFAAGSDISSITAYYDFASSDYISYEDFLSANTQAIFEQAHAFRLSEAPDANTPFQINIRLVLDNGEEYEVTSEEITLSL